MYNDNTQGKKARFTSKRFDAQLAAADDAQNRTFGTTSRRREIGKQIETQDGNPREDRRAGGPAALPQKGAR
jgi:hypothetical protein